MWNWRKKKANATAIDASPDLEGSAERHDAPVRNAAPVSVREKETPIPSGGRGNARSLNQSRNHSMPSQMEDVKIPSPPYTSSKTGFNVAPGGRDIDEPRAMEVATNERFRDEDRLTNATNDPRIGTHGRKYEP